MKIQGAHKMTNKWIESAIATGRKIRIVMEREDWDMHELMNEWAHGDIAQEIGAYPNHCDWEWWGMMEAVAKGWEPRIVRGWRYGEIPADGRSFNYRDNEPEDGVSLMELEDGCGSQDAISAMFIEAQDRPIVWCEGYLLPHRGSDGEPLICGARKIEAPKS